MHNERHQLNVRSIFVVYVEICTRQAFQCTNEQSHCLAIIYCKLEFQFSQLNFTAINQSFCSTIARNFNEFIKFSMFEWNSIPRCFQLPRLPRFKEKVKNQKHFDPEIREAWKSFSHNFNPSWSSSSPSAITLKWINLLKLEWISNIKDLRGRNKNEKEKK
jgi:hypothetical protein